jgi:hypothetical protein
MLKQIGAVFSVTAPELWWFRRSIVLRLDTDIHALTRMLKMLWIGSSRTRRTYGTLIQILSPSVVPQREEMRCSRLEQGRELQLDFTLQ